MRFHRSFSITIIIIVVVVRLPPLSSIKTTTNKHYKEMKPKQFEAGPLEQGARFVK